MAQASNLRGFDVYLTTDQTVTSVTGLTPIKFSQLSGYDNKTNSFVTYYDMSSAGGAYAKKVSTVKDCGQLQVSVPAEEAGDMTIFDTIDASAGNTCRIFVKYNALAQIAFGKVGVYADAILEQKQNNDINENGYAGAQFTFQISGPWTSMGTPSTTE